MRIEEPINVVAGLRHSARIQGQKPALVQGKYRATFQQLDRFASQVANGVLGQGLTQGQAAAVIMPNIPEFVEIVFGLSKAGVVVTTINSRSAVAEIAYILKDADCEMVFANAELVPQVDEALTMLGKALPAAKRIVVGSSVPGWTAYWDWQAQASDRDPMLPVGDDDLYALHYTSGTTGRPKGVMLSHKTRTWLMYTMALEYGYSRTKQSMAVAPLYHGAGLAMALAPILVGGTVHLLRKFDPEETLTLIASAQINDFFMVPTMFHAIFGLERSCLERYNVKSVDTIVSNASALPQATKIKILEYWQGVQLHETYGSTEGGVVTNLRPPDQLRKLSCVGLPFALNDVVLLDDDGKPVKPGEVGELFSRSPFNFKGYLGLPEETSAAVRNGYVTVGDLARQDEEGYFYIVDRKKDLVISGGVNIYPREVEEVLHAHPAVREAAVIGLPDDYWGESLMAVVAFRAGAGATQEELITFCRQRLAGFKVPRSYAFLPELPRSAAGKILKRELREKFQAGA